MELVKENILDLLGSDSRRYQSAILTSFSFDFSFFESRVMRSLKGAGIRNILVLVDEQSLNELLENPSGMEFRKNIGYGIYPIHAPGAFHPKIIFCSGPKEGFFAIGSGNLTAAGHGSNDELWSVFHYKGSDSVNARIFGQAWNYLLSITSNIEGNSADKIFRMSRYSPWIAELPKSDLVDFVSIDSDEIALLPVYEGDERMELVYRLLNQELVKEIKALSPYYEKDGLLLTSFRKNYPDANIKVVIDRKYGLLPVGINPRDIEFHDWQLSSPKKEDEPSRLHGKLIVFSLEGDVEFIISGSSNATTAGFGNSEKKAKNKELNLIIRRKNSDVFDELGLDLTNDSLIDLSQINANQTPDVFDRTDQIIQPIKIKYAELAGSELSLSSEGSSRNTVSLQVFDRDRKLIETTSPLIYQSQLTIQLIQVERLPFLVCFIDEERGRVSNYALIQDTAIHLKTNPDPNTEKLESMFDNIERGNFGQVADLLGLVSFVQEEELSSKGTFSAGSENTGRVEAEKEYEIAPTYEAFTHVSEAYLLKQKGLLFSPSVRIAEFLATVKRKQMSVEIETEQNLESQIIDTDSLEGEDPDMPTGEELKSARPGIHEFQKEKNAVLSYLYNYQKHLLSRVKRNFNANNIKDFEKTEVNITDYSNLLIAMHLIKNYVTKRFEYTDNNQIKSETFLLLTGDKSYNNQKAFLTQFVPIFLLLAEQGVKKYDFEGSQNKITSFRKEAFFNLVFLISNTSWSDREREWMELMILNAVHITIKDSRISMTDLLKELDVWIHKTGEDDIYRSYRVMDEYRSILKRTLKPTIETLEGLKKGRKEIVLTETLQPGDYIYNSKLGICLVKKVREGNCPGQKELFLCKPGFPWDENEKDWIFRQEFRKNVLLRL